MIKKIILLSGDPNSINSELIFKSWKKINKTLKKKIYLISNYNLINKQFRKLNYKIKTIKVKSIDDEIKTNKLKILNIDLNSKKTFDISKKLASKFIKESLDLAHELASTKKECGIINCSIDKKLLNKKNIGVTEYLSLKCGIKDRSETMLIYNKDLAVSPITMHDDLRNISKKITKKKIIIKVNVINKWYKKNYNLKPKIGILGLNPHNAELRKNSEEKKIIIPAIADLKKMTINISGPYVADTFFIKDFKKFDVIIGMYHDQVLAPFKTLYKFNAINITLGLPYIRISPDHGVAKDIIGKNKADTTSLINCLQFMNSL